MSTDPALMTYQPRFMYVDPQFYDVVKGDVAAWKNPGPMIAQPAASVVQQFLILENRLVDSDRFEEWIDLFTEDCLYWVPTVAAGGTGPLSATDTTTTNSRAPTGAAGTPANRAHPRLGGQRSG